MKKSRSINRKTLSLFWRFTRDKPVLFWYGTFGAVAAVFVTDILPPLVISRAFTFLQNQAATGHAVTLDALQPYLLLYALLCLLSFTLWRTQVWCVWKYAVLTEQTIVEHLFNHIQNLGSKFHADHFGGALVSQVNKFTTSYDRFVGDFTWSILTGLTAFVGSLVVLAFISPFYALLFFVVALIYFAVLFLLMKKQAPFNRKVSSSESQLTAKVADTITNVATVRAFAGEPIERKLFRKQTDTTTRARLNLMSVQLRNEAISSLGTNIINVIAFAGGILAITRFDAPVGTLYLVLTYTLSLTNRLWQFMFVLRNLNQIFGDAAEMTEILQLQPEVRDVEQPEESRIHRGGIAFRDVVFHYDEGKPALFDHLNFQIKPGEKIGLVGHSGGGKTTITQLLLRFLDIQDGQIVIDGQDISRITQRDLRSHITYVPQEPLLFHRSLAANIAYGRKDATKKEVVAAAKMAHAHEFIEGLADGYDTLVGERGIKLSGGQRQRIAIARAMLKNAPILVLDEATSALDSESEQLIQDALWRLMENRTAIVIAHRLSTIQKMDRILVMENGAIVEQGTHKELLRAGGIYASLWNHQSGGFLEE
jgi:ATP-binding cassette subfamily B protein